MKLRFDYINHNGITSTRQLELEDVRWEANPPDGYQPGWALFGMDLDKHVKRTFFLARIVMPDKGEANHITHTLRISP